MTVDCLVDAMKTILSFCKRTELPGTKPGNTLPSVKDAFAKKAKYMNFKKVSIENIYYLFSSYWHFVVER